MSVDPKLITVLTLALDARQALLSSPFESAVRLFNGFSEGQPGLVVELFGRTLVVHEHVSLFDEDGRKAMVEIVGRAVPGLRCVLWKERHSLDPELRRGRMLLGDESEIERRVRENGVRYALDLRLNQDDSLYLDTRVLRALLKSELSGKRVLNAFAYTGALGVAAAAGGAALVVHVDRHREYLNLGKASYSLNGLEVRRSDFQAQDFFTYAAGARKHEQLFDAVILDPPFFSATSKGRVDIESEAERLLNKARPLVGDGGMLVLVNHALFVSGQAYMELFERVAKDGYITFERSVVVPPDVVGLVPSESAAWPTDPAPFNHPTKIAILRVSRKDGRRASAR